MSFFIRPISIKYKLILMIMLTTISALLIAGIAFIVIDQNTARETMAERIDTLSRVIADRSTAAITFGDQDAATRMLSALKQDRSVLVACTYSLSNTLFASYKNSEVIDCPDKIQRTGIIFESDYLYLTQPVLLKQKHIGTLHIISSLKEIEKRLQWYMFTVIIIILIASIAAFYISRQLQKNITRRLIKLRDTTEYISNNADYSQQLPQQTEDEIGTLYRSFSKMIEQIRAREVARNVAEESLRENEHNLAITLDSIGDAVIATDAKGIVTRMNVVAEQLTGWLLIEAKGKNLKDIFLIYDAGTHESIANPIDKVIASGEIVYLSNHTTLKSKNGQEYHIADSAAPIRDSNENILGMVLVFNDVSEQYKLRETASKSKRDMKDIMDHSPAVIYVKDINGRYTFINQKFKILHHLKSDDIIGKTDYDIFPVAVADHVTGNDKTVLEARHAMEIEEEVPHDGEIHFFVANKFPLFNEQGEIYSICGISTDITERKQQEEQLRRSQKMDALGKLTGGVAHDYNNMLGVILGYAEILEDRLSDQPDLAKYASKITHAGIRGANLTKKLLNFSRNKPSEAETINLNVLLTRVTQLLEKTLTARIKLVFDLQTDLWPVRLDSGDMEDAIINISINAMHAIKDNGQLNIQTSNEHVNAFHAQRLNIIAGDYVLLSISDTGSGMDEKMIEKIFDPFFSTKGEHGTGLGLSQVYGFVERSGGTVNVNSKLNHGSTFTLYFPRCLVSQLEDVSKHGHLAADFSGTETILVVDDEPELLNLTSEILKNKGYRILSAGSAKQALELLQTETVDLLLSDIIMPEMDGYQLAATVKEKYPAIKIQLASGYAENYNAGMVDDVLKQQLIHKPYNAQKLLKTIRDLLNCISSA